MLDGAKRLWKWIRTDPKDEAWQRTLDRYSAQLAKDAPAKFRREIFNDPMASREMLLKQRIWVDAQGNRILFEHMDVQRLLNILIYKSTRGYKQYLREYFGKMVGVAADPEYYRQGLRLAGNRVAAHSHVDMTTQAILQELVSRGVEWLGEEDRGAGHGYDVEPPIDRDDEVPY